MSNVLKYTKDKRLRLWSKKENNLLALIDTNKYICGLKKNKGALGLTIIAILKEQQDALPKNMRVK